MPRQVHKRSATSFGTPGRCFLSMKAFCFDPEMAVRYGVDEAVMLWNLDFWIQKNKANGKHFHDGLWWTYNTAKAFAELFPFWSAGQVRRILTKLEEAGVIKTGNYNSSTYDRTMWYAIDYAELYRQNPSSESDKCILRNQQMEIAESGNGFSETNKPIPNINADINTNSRHIGDSARDTRLNKPHLFIDSCIAQFDDFVEALKSDPNYAGADLRYYYEVIKNWSNSNGNKKKDWIATAKNWLLREYREGKLVREKPQGADVLSEGAKRFLERNMALDSDELWPGL